MVVLKPVRTLLFLAAPDDVDPNGMTALCIACEVCPAEVAIALLDGDADIDFVTPASSSHSYPGFTPLMYTMSGNNAGVAKLLLKCGAEGTKHTTHAACGLAAGSTALDIARLFANRFPDSAETFVVLRKRCCNTCGITSPGLAAKTAGVKKHLKRCGDCPASGSRARYCPEACQRADWASRHRGEGPRRGGRGRLLAPRTEPAEYELEFAMTMSTTCEPTCPESTSYIHLVEYHDPPRGRRG